MAEPLYMDAVIRQNASLPKGVFKVMIAALVFLNLVFALFMVVAGAWPIPVFLGLDVLGLWLAFRASYRAAERAEHVTVTAREVSVRQAAEGREKTVWTSPTAFTRVALEETGEHANRLRLHLSGRALTVARSLSPGERSEFAEALERAIRRARAERHS